MEHVALWRWITSLSQSGTSFREIWRLFYRLRYCLCRFGPDARGYDGVCRLPALSACMRGWIRGCRCIGTIGAADAAVMGSYVP
jgi:hypothetical protein